MNKIITALALSAILAVITGCGDPPTSISPVPAGCVINSGDTSFPEGNVTSIVKIPVDLSVDSTSIVTVSFATSDLTATAGSDYTATSGTLTFPAGSTSQFISLEVKGDTAVELDETLKITFSEPTNATLLHGSITLTIKNDDQVPLPNISAVDVIDVGTPGNHPTNVELRLSAISTKQVSVSWSTVAGTATAPTDFAQASGTAVIAAGTTMVSIAISVNGNWVSGAGRAFQVALSNPVNAILSTPIVNISIPNKAGSVSVTINRDKLPTYGALTGKLSGTISGINPINCKVACYLYINGGWWTKPYDVTPFTSVSPDGTWSCNVVTGGPDQNAIKFAAYLLPKIDAAPLPVTLGSSTIPAAIINASLASDSVDRPKP